MTSDERKNIEQKIIDGARLAVLRLLEKEIRNNGELIVGRDGKVIRLEAKKVQLK